MRARRYMWWTRHLFVGILVACATLAATASAALAKGNYTATVSPGSVALGASTTFAVTLTNTSKANPLNAAIVQPPRGFVVTAVSRPSPSGNSTLSNGRVVLKGLSLHAGETESVAVTATTPGSCGQSSWNVEAFKSSLQGQRLTLDRANSSLTTTVSCGRTVSTDCPPGRTCSTTLVRRTPAPPWRSVGLHRRQVDRVGRRRHTAELESGLLQLHASESRLVRVRRERLRPEQGHHLDGQEQQSRHVQGLLRRALSSSKPSAISPRGRGSCPTGVRAS